MKKRMTRFFILCLLPCAVLAGSPQAFYAYRQGQPLQAMKGLKQLAKQKNKAALYYLGLMALHGYGEAKNTQRALKLITTSGERGYLPAQFFLGRYYWDKKNNPQKALTWFQRAAKRGNVDAQMFTAGAYLYGYGTKKNKEKARWYFIKAAKSGNANAQYVLGMYFAKSRNRRNKKLGRIWLRKSAKQGNALAKNQVIRLQHGVKVISETASKQDPREAMLTWLSPAHKGQGVPVRYQLQTGTFVWKNKASQKQGAYHLSPKLVTIQRSAIYSSKPTLVDPDDIRLSAFVSTLGATHYMKKKPHLFIPHYDPPKSSNYTTLFTNSFRQAIHGISDAQFNLAVLYQEGLGTEKNITKAIEWYKKSAEQHNLKAEYNLGLLYLEGDGVSKNYKKALVWLNQSALRGDTYAQYLLGVIHEYGLGHPGEINYISKDIRHASSMYHLAANAGYTKAQFNLAELYASGLLGQGRTLKAKQDLYQLILALYENAANQGAEKAKLALAYYYIDSKDKTKQAWAFNLAKEEARKNDPYAAFILALMFDRGAGTEESEGKAIYWYAEAVKANNPVAEFILGSYFYLGKGVEASKHVAYEYLTKASKSNLPYADYNLAVIQYNEKPQGDFLPLLQRAARSHYNKASLVLADYYLAHSTSYKRWREAAAIYLKQARLGYADAQLKLGYMYEQGILFNKNFRTAAFWYKKAAQHKNALAQYLYGNMFQLGKLGRPSPVSAMRWYQRAADQGSIPAKVALGFLEETVNHNYKKAMNLYQAAAEEGSPQAHFDLGLMYEYGKGVPVNYKQAYQFYKKASEKSFAPAQYALANMYLKETAPKIWFTLQGREERAVIALKAAAKQNHSYALYKLSQMYAKGVGVAKNEVKSKTLYQQALANGYHPVTVSSDAPKVS